MKKWIYIFSLLFYLCGCQSDDIVKPDNPPKSGKYISSYLTKFNSVKSEQILNKGDSYLQFYLVGENATYNSFMFKQISDYYKDSGYTGYALPTNISVLSDSIKSIHIYTLKDFNKAYIKNDKIDDIVKIKYKSFFEFIKSNYQDTSQIDNFITLNDFNSETTKLFVTGFQIEFNKLPTTPGSYPLKIKIETYSDLIESQFVINVY